jgi:hypothetical protein
MFCMLCGLVLEVVGYAGRLMSHHDPFRQSPFLIYIICLTVGPAFFSAAVYLCFARIVVVYGEANSRFAPRVYTITFVVFDILSLVLQGAGGGIAAIAERGSKQMYKGIHVMIGGLVWQVVSLMLFMLMSVDFALRTKKNAGGRNLALQGLTVSLKWKAFLCGNAHPVYPYHVMQLTFSIPVGLALATITIFARCIYRVVELNAGFDSRLANEEVTFMVLEGALVAIAVLSVSTSHPGLIFRSHWVEADFQLGNKICKATGSSTTSVEMEQPHITGHQSSSSTESDRK